MLPGEIYHVFNHANGKENLFVEDRNYHFFLDKLNIYVLPVCRIFSYCLMPNHFHFMVQIRSEEELQTVFSDKNKNAKGNDNSLLTTDIIEKKISKHFSNLFNSYTQAFNKVYDRRGSLFMPNMKREEVKDDGSFCKVVHYIHANPVHHQFTKRADDWLYSSYKTFLSDLPTKIEREYVLKIFGGLEWFIKYHKQPIDPKIKFME